jgi:hypothetical protein
MLTQNNIGYYRDLTRETERSEHALDAAMALCVGLKISVHQGDGYVIAQSKMYMAVETYEGFTDSPYASTRKAIARIATKVMDDFQRKIRDEVQSAH